MLRWVFVYGVSQLIMERRRFISVVSVGISSFLAGCANELGSGPEEQVESEVGPELTTQTPVEETTSVTTENQEDPTAAGSSETPVSQQSNTEWLQFQFDAANTGYNPNGIGPTEQIRERWNIEGGEGVYSSVPVVKDDTVYFPDEDQLYAVSTSGEEVWSRSFGYITPAIDGDILVTVSINDGKVIGLSSSTGETIWEYSGGISTSPSVFGGSVFAAGDSLYQLSISNGAQENRYEFPEDGYANVGRPGSPIVTDNSIYANYALDEDRVAKFSRDTGEEEWHVTLVEIFDGRYYSRNALVGDTLYTVGGSGSADEKTLVAIDASNGETKWKYAAPPTASSPTVTSNAVYTGGYEGLHKIDRNSGGRQWVHKTEGDVEYAPAVVGDTLYFGDDEGFVYGLNPGGEEIWRYNTSEQIGRIAVSDEVVYVLSKAATLFALSE
jgi:outer membrane protein assembly factor BamB